MGKDYSPAIRAIMGEMWIQLRAPAHERDLELDVMPQKVSICIGVRRCGKSTFLMQHVKRLVKEGLPKENLVCLNFSDDRLAGMELEDLDQIVRTYYGQYPRKKDEHVCFLFDEIQEIAGWEKFVDRLRRTVRGDVFLTGSSARLLSWEIGTQMRGRSLTWELYPFSFGEYAAAKGIPRDGSAAFTAPMELQKAWSDYRRQGGFPEVMGKADRQRIATLQEYYNTLLYRDIIDRHNCRNTKLVRVLIRRLVNQMGTLVSFSKMQRDLASAGYSTTREMLAEIFSWLEDAYFLFGVTKYSASAAEQERAPKKLYLIDHALTEALGTGISAQRGQSLENIVYLALRRNAENVYYYSTAKGNEVDFLARDAKGGRHLVQVCESLEEESTRKRELRALSEAMVEQQLTDGWIVTEDSQEEIPVAAGNIHVIPARDFLLPAQAPCFS